MENSVFGRLSVFFSSIGSAIGLSARITPDLRTCFRALALVYRTKVLFELPVRWFSCTVRNIGKQCKPVCYNECRLVSAAQARNLSRPARILSDGCTNLRRFASKVKREPVPDKFINLLPPEITKAKMSGAGSQPAIPVPSSVVPKFVKPDILIPDNFWSNLKQFFIERPIKVRERADAPFTKTSFGAGVGDNLRDFFSFRPAPKRPVNSRLAVAWGSNFGGFGTRIQEFLSPPRQAPLPFAVKP